MKIKYLTILLTSLLFFRCSKPSEKEKVTDLYEQQAKQLIGFFDDHAWSEELGTYYSEIDNEGKVVSNKVYTVATSRLIYGLSFASKYDPAYLEKAQKVAEFQKQNLIGKSDKGSFSHSYVEKAKAGNQTSLDVWQQAYGLCGLSELYRQTKNPELLPILHELHHGFIARFRDTEKGGLWGNYDVEKGQVTGSKSLQSLMYPLTAYMINLWEADQEHKELYESQIKENLSLLYQYGWNQNTEWVNVQFNDDWSPKIKEDGTMDFTVTVGHNFQLSALLLRASKFQFLDHETKERYKKLGQQIIDITLKKDIFHQQKIQRGFYSEFDPNTSKVLDNRKTWWQHAEAIIALSLYEGKYGDEEHLFEQYFFNTFVDRKYGGEYFYATKEDQPITSELKGSIGKSTYHTIEMIRFLNKK
ncbi:AGE family epimerase/isomerase [Flammeovirga sp. OC4]|uniref:AGE family epimerase/isomerase n=1 Tax=Flammeovirga sp. OC4 TaxID=1382345 RepID=UPI0005C5C867|nr:AGE family epimerase/isomerase [Flammeovirga sp. OC4]